jgi:hypothetical protein
MYLLECTTIELKLMESYYHVAISTDMYHALSILCTMYDTELVIFNDVIQQWVS